jgi:hypothetical protein
MMAKQYFMIQTVMFSELIDVSFRKDFPNEWVEGGEGKGTGIETAG